MKQSIFANYLITIGLMLTLSCKKSSNTISAPAAVNVVNAMAVSNPIIPVFGTYDTIQYFTNAQNIGYPGNLEYILSAGNTQLYVAQGTDTTSLELKSALFRGSLSLQPGGIYSFFLAGDTTSPDTLFVLDKIPNYADSSAGIRFVNLSPGSQAISITLEGNSATQTEFSGLEYKGISPFKGYPANSVVPGGAYNFVIRDQSTGDSLQSFSWYFTLYRNNTAIICGSEDPTSPTPLQVLQINNY
jgi:hypothetical protein